MTLLTSVSDVHISQRRAWSVGGCHWIPSKEDMWLAERVVEPAGKLSKGSAKQKTFSPSPLVNDMFNTVIRRAYTTKALIPPNVAAATKVSGSGAKDAQLAQLVAFYKVCKSALPIDITRTPAVDSCTLLSTLELAQGYCWACQALRSLGSLQGPLHWWRECLCHPLASPHFRCLRRWLHHRLPLPLE